MKAEDIVVGQWYWVKAGDKQPGRCRVTGVCGDIVTYRDRNSVQHQNLMTGTKAVKGKHISAQWFYSALAADIICPVADIDLPPEARQKDWSNTIHYAMWAVMITLCGAKLILDYVSH